MRHALPYLIALLTLFLSGCKSGNGVHSYWEGDDMTISESTYAAAEEKFAKFAELLVAAPEDEADEALEDLMDRIHDKEVEYYIYSEWLESAFHNYFSPCRNPRIFKAAVNRMTKDRILSREDLERLGKLADMDRYNLPGKPCTVPEGAQADEAALYLVLNLDCRTCLQWLEGLAEEYPEAEHIALCFGHSRTPSVPGWKYLRPEGMDDIFELEAAPFWFLTEEDGTVSIPYSIEFEAPRFASPQIL